MNRLCLFAVLLALTLAGTGCGSFMAHSLASAPNRYPTWFAPEPPVSLDFNPKLLTNFVAQSAEVGPPSAKLRYRIIDPADYALRVTVTNWFADNRKDYDFDFQATVPAATNRWTAAPRGTVFLLHGYALAQFSMMPWALQLGQDGWRCVLVDLRGHGKSTGNRCYFTVKEADDMRQLLDTLQSRGQVTGPVSAVGESMGAVLALRWMTADPRVTSVVAIAPYASFSNAVMNIRHEYADWVPRSLVAAGVKKLPDVLGVAPDQFDSTTFLHAHPVSALYVAGELDKIAPPPEVQKVKEISLPTSQYIMVPEATHESLTYYFPQLTIPIENWLSATNRPPPAR